jgi:hypothetical protein
MQLRQIFIFFCAVMQTACGGAGVDEIPKTGVAISHMLGNWANINPNPNCILITASNGSPLRLKEGPMRLTTQTYQESFTYHAADDVTCANVITLEIQTYTVTWSAPTSSLTKAGAVRAVIDGPTITYNELPELESLQPTGNSLKALFYSAESIFESRFSVLTTVLDQDGYPLGTDLPSFSYAVYSSGN